MAYYTLNSYKLRGDPFWYFKALESQGHCFFLDSSLKGNKALGRYSFLGANPFGILRPKGQDPFLQLRESLEKYTIDASSTALPFLGGAVGYLGYDAGFALEKRLRKDTPDDIGVPESFFALYNTIVAFDHYKKLMHICAVGFPEKKTHLAKKLCSQNIRRMLKLFSKVGPERISRQRSSRYGAAGYLRSNFSRQRYLTAIDKTKAYIKAGDIYQLNLSQRFCAQSRLSSIQAYSRLRTLSPSYFGAYFDCGDFQIISSSPERFMKLEKGWLHTRPMKGTRPRGESCAKDIRLKRELLRSAKDKAELMMIVDLERNDLGKVCNYNSIRVPALRELEQYQTVFQTTATIRGRLYKGKDMVDVLRATFPGGSITGCPKIRAMEIIEELEPSRRCVYTGSLGYLSFSGNMDFNILIRTMLKKKNVFYFGAGGGIVADSIPQREYEETLVKARAMLEAINACPRAVTKGFLETTPCLSQ